MVFRWFVGIDWAAEKYDVCVLDGSGKVIGKRVIQHSGSAIAELLDWLQEIAGGNAEAEAIAIETPRGAVVAQRYNRADGIVSGGDLAPNKLRILLMAAFGAGLPGAAISLAAGRGGSSHGPVMVRPDSAVPLPWALLATTRTW